VDKYGWHSSFMGGIDRIISKIESYSHQEFNNDHIKDNLLNNITNKKDLFFRDGDLVEVDINKVYPQNFIDIVKEKYSYLL
jgi:beta-1,4-mannosyl-glycoprotein beta-1,4-N-acetylglucosaminyltransferase